MSLGAKGSPIPRKKKGRYRIPLHVRRIRADLKIHDRGGAQVAETLAVRVLMNDLSSSGAGMFSCGKVQTGQSVELCFETGPGPLAIRGVVVWCQENTCSSKVISEQNKFTHRLGVEFKFKDAEEERTVKKLYEDYAREVLFGAKAA